MRDDIARLHDVALAAEAIARHVAVGRDGFEADELIQGAVIYQLIVIGEAIAQLSVELTSSHPDVPWQEPVGLRNLLVHRYHEIDLEMLWATIETDVPNLANDVTQIVEELER